MEGVELDVCRAYDGDPVPSSIEGYDGLVVMGGAMGAHDDEKAPWLPATRELIRLAADGCRADARHLPRPPALHGRARRRDPGQPERPAARPARRRLDRRGRRRRADGRPGRPATRDALERRHRDPAARRGPAAGDRRAPARCRRPGMRRRCGASSGTPRSTTVSSPPGRPTAACAPTEKERVLDDLVRSRHDLDDAWRPLAQRFADAGRVDAAAPSPSRRRAPRRRRRTTRGAGRARRLRRPIRSRPSRAAPTTGGVRTTVGAAPAAPASARRRSISSISCACPAVSTPPPSTTGIGFVEDAEATHRRDREGHDLLGLTAYQRRRDLRRRAAATANRTGRQLHALGLGERAEVHRRDELGHASPGRRDGGARR